MTKSERAAALRKKAEELEQQERFEERMQDADKIPTCPECGGRNFKLWTWTLVAQSIDYERNEDDGDWDGDYQSGDHTDTNNSAECNECGADVRRMLERHGWQFYDDPQVTDRLDVVDPDPDDPPPTKKDAAVAEETR